MAWPLQSKAKAFYGDPSVNNAQWQMKNLVQVPVPWATYYGKTRVPKIRIHRLCAGSLIRVMDQAWKAIGKNQAEAVRRGWSVYNGTYAYRPIRNSKTISNHAFGAAIDWDAGHNALGSNSRDKIGFEPDDPLVLAFKKEGWRWGGDYTGRSDPMHFEAVRG